MRKRSLLNIKVWQKNRVTFNEINFGTISYGGFATSGIIPNVVM